MINQIITRKVRQEFARSMRFEEGLVPRIPEVVQQKPRLLYLHIPFCEKLCPYCSFNRIVFDESLCRDYFRALRLELLLYKKRGFAFQGVYVGGGTPTVMIDELADTLALARESFHIHEISVETNPNHLTDTNIAALKRVGVNRLSVGIQSFDNKLLKAMDRFDKYGSGESIRDRLKQILGQFDTLNADMIFNFPSQNMDILNRDLDTLMEIGMDQITYYPLMVSDSTREAVSKTLGRVDDRQEEQFYHRIVERLVPAYRFSSAWCFSRKTAMIDEYIVDYDEYAGLGSGSIGYLNGTCYANTFNIRQYIAQVERGDLPLMASRNFNLRDQIRYDFLMKLFGMKLDVPALEKKYGGKFLKHIWLDLVAFRLAGGLRYDPPDYYLTPRGRYYWVIMMREFFISVNNFRDFCREQEP
ncbi:MAG: coproporphyrinogen III oxidase [Syntrophus sp. (in: bacteria)]|nr:coproporphyrinogen III oxidase [Syntrophus sp. (in: bacteria)]